jgi:hypothetical protein
MNSAGVPGAIASHWVCSPSVESTVPPAIGSEWPEMPRILERSCLQSYSYRNRSDIEPDLRRSLKSVNS